MFDFLFKRKSKSPTPAQAISAQAASQQENQEIKKQQAERARNAALAQLEQISQDEAAVVNFLTTCDFADGRLKAAQYIHTEAALNQVLVAVRNTDRRVAKLVQSRLDLILQAGKQQAAAQAHIAAARQMAAAQHLLANQVAELDRQVAGLKGFPAELREEFELLRQTLDTRLQAQTALQRRVLNLIAKLHELAATDDIQPQQAQHTLGQLQAEFDDSMSQVEAVSLPKNLAQEFAEEIADLRKTIDAQLDVLRKQAEEHARAEKKAADKAAAIADAAAALAAQAAIEFTAAPDAVAADIAQRDGTQPAPAPVVKKESQENREKPALITSSVGKITAAIQGIEDALAQGTVQVALKLDRELRGIDLKASGASTSLRDKLTRLRSELGHLQGWAKWGGGVSRDELIKTAEELAALKLEPNELAKRVADLRDRWKAMEAVSGSANKEVWERFDAACTQAYAPAASYFQQLGEERKANLEKADAMIAELRSHAGLLNQPPVDWKALVNLGQQARQKWQALGPIDRKHRTRLEAEFDAAYKILWTPLEERRQQEILSREALISEAQALNPDQRAVVDQVRALQARWQEQAGSVPLKRKDEQALWEKFRAACDAIFAQRRAASETADSQRKESLQAKENICAELEQAELADDQKIKQLLQQSAAAWRNAGYVPKADETAIEQRYKAAVNKLEELARQLLGAKSAELKQVLEQKIRICHALETMLVLDAVDDARIEQLSAEWAALPNLPAKAASSMNRRFAAIVKALQARDQAYVGVLRDNAASFDQHLLQLEIIAGVESPEAYSRERLQMQVKVLQASLQSGGKQTAAEDQLRDLYALAAMTTEAQLQRLRNILAVSAI
ncbi:DUF349 domain-containing protein [Undibacterium terreum]|uniref:DUF349 domain-containing protein n=1 Tax=Undibacterium terreum TaxID=1224302 RepID=A0A916US63_9BURK|nr:DUF349 domain-containing protein [Undibacterium terreum]GGC85764.1 hypothetical protein GCM10011396_36330 [Undibacterium terreum]